MPGSGSEGARAAAAKVQDFNAQEVANTLRAMAKTSRVSPEVFDPLCRSAAAKAQDFNAQHLNAKASLEGRDEPRNASQGAAWLDSCARSASLGRTPAERRRSRQDRSLWMGPRCSIGLFRQDQCFILASCRRRVLVGWPLRWTPV